MSTQGQKEIPYREWSRQKGGLAAVATVTCQKLCFAAAGQQNERSVPVALFPIESGLPLSATGDIVPDAESTPFV